MPARKPRTPRAPGGRPAGHCRRDIADAIRYRVKEGIQWRAMPADFPPYQTVYDVLHGWHRSGATEQMRDELRVKCRIAVIDSQSVKAAGWGSRGYDAGKKINGRKRHIAVDTIGLLLTVLITAAGVQDRDAAQPLLWNLRRAFPSVRLTWADAGYAGKLVTWAKTKLKPGLALQIVKHTKQPKFVVLPRRWVVERNFSWITRSRRTVRDLQRLPTHHETMVYWAMTIIMPQRLARHNRLHQLHPPEFPDGLQRAEHAKRRLREGAPLCALLLTANPAIRRLGGRCLRWRRRGGSSPIGRRPCRSPRRRRRGLTSIRHSRVRR